MLEVSKKQTVKTRKKHECHGCCETIDKGEAAVHVRGKEDGRHMHFHLHVQCHITAMKQKLFAESFTRGAINANASFEKFDTAKNIQYPF